MSGGQVYFENASHLFPVLEGIHSLHLQVKGSSSPRSTITLSLV